MKNQLILRAIFSIALLCFLQKSIAQGADTIFVYDTIYVYDTVYVEEIVEVKDFANNAEYAIINLDTITKTGDISFFIGDESATFSINHIILNEKQQNNKSMKKKSMIAIGLGLAMNALFAQTDFGVKVDYIYSIESNQDHGFDYKAGVMNNGLGASVFSSTRIGNRTALRVGLDFAYLIKSDDYKETVTAKWDDDFYRKYISGVGFNQLMIPIGVTATYGKCQPYLGVYYKRKWAGTKIQDSYDNIAWSKSEGTDFGLSKTEILGGSLGLDYFVTDRVSLGVQASVGLLGSNLFTFQDSERNKLSFGDYRNTQFKASVTYLLTNKNKG